MAPRQAVCEGCRTRMTTYCHELMSCPPSPTQTGDGSRREELLPGHAQTDPQEDQRVPALPPAALWSFRELAHSLRTCGPVGGSVPPVWIGCHDSGVLDIQTDRGPVCGQTEENSSVSAGVLSDFFYIIEVSLEQTSRVSLAHLHHWDLFLFLLLVNLHLFHFRCLKTNVTVDPQVWTGFYQQPANKQTLLHP